MDQIPWTPILTMLGAALSGLGTIAYAVLTWMGKKADLLIDTHVELNKKLCEEIPWKHEKLQDMDEKLTDVHGMVKDLHGSEEPKPSKVRRGPVSS